MNNDCHIVLAAPQESMTDYFYKNTDADEMIFVHEGSGIVENQYGELPFSYGDYLVLPRGTIYQIEFQIRQEPFVYCGIFYARLRFPKRYMSKYGQLMEHSPFCERDIRPPQNLKTYDEKGDFLIKAKKKGMMYGLHYGTHPFDVVGWDGCCYPYVFSIHDFEPITGRVHLPPPVHQTFEANTFCGLFFCAAVV